MNSEFLNMKILERINFTILGFSHTCDLLGVNYCMNFFVHTIERKNGHTTDYWTFQSIQNHKCKWTVSTVSLTTETQTDSVYRLCERSQKIPFQLTSTRVTI